MVDEKRNLNRIPFESLKNDTISSWSLPIINDNDSVLKSAEIEKKQAEAQKKNREKEKVEDVSPEDKPQPMTAEQLQVLSEEARQEGYAEGYAEGLKKGTDQGLEKGTKQGQKKAYDETKAEMMDTQNRLRGIAQSLFEPMQQQTELLENTIVDMAMMLARNLIRQEITQSPLVLFNVVQRAVNALPIGEKNITIVLNDADAELMENVLTAKKSSWKIERDNQVTSGGCMVKTENSFIDYEIENRLKQYLDEVMYQGDDGIDTLPEVDNVSALYNDTLTQNTAVDSEQADTENGDIERLRAEEIEHNSAEKKQVDDVLNDQAHEDTVVKENTAVEANTVVENTAVEASAAGEDTAVEASAAGEDTAVEENTVAEDKALENKITDDNVAKNTLTASAGEKLLADTAEDEK